MMKKSKLIAMILVVSIIFSVFPQTGVKAEEMAEYTSEETEYQDETNDTTNIDDSIDSEDSEETRADMQSEQNNTIEEQNNTIEEQNDDSERYQKESSMQSNLFGAYTYRQSDGYVAITKYTGLDKDVVIPTEILGMPVVAVDEYAFQNCTTMKKLTIPNSIEEIGTCAFKGCENLEEIYWDCTLKDKGTTPFLNCSALKTVCIGKNCSNRVQNRANDCYGSAVEAFVVDKDNPYCVAKEGVLYWKRKDGGYDLVQYPVAKKDKKFIISTDVKSVWQYALSGNSYLTEIIVNGNNFRMDEQYALCNLDSLRKITVQGTYKDVYRYGGAWVDNCENLRELYIYADLPEDVLAFSKCYNLKQVFIGANVSKVTECASESVSTFHVDEANLNYVSHDGVLFSKGSNKELVLYPPGKENSSYTIPEDTREIASDAFGGCEFLQKISFCPSNECKIKKNTFLCCEALEELEFGGNISYVDLAAVNRCPNIKKISLGKCVEEWPHIELLGEQSELEEIQIEEGNPNYSSVDGVLFDKTRRTLILYPSGKTEDTYVVPETVATIGCDSFSMNHYLLSIEIPETVTTITMDSLPRYCTIIGTRGSAAETYALNNNLPFLDKKVKNENGTVVLPNNGTSVWKEEMMEEIIPEDDLYIISNAAQLAWIGEQVGKGNDFLGKSIVLTVDIDLESKEWTPIGNGENPFRGNFDGRNHTISNLKVKGIENAGLFGGISSKAASGTVKISNLKIKNAQIEDCNYAGVLSGYARVYKGAEIQIDNCTVSGEISESQESGGLIGTVLGTDYHSKIQIKDINSKVDISAKGSGNGGGIIGRIISGDSYASSYIYNGTIDIENCKYRGTVLGRNGGCVGGILGRAETNGPADILLKHCKTEGLVSCSATGCAGGVVGELVGTKTKVISCVNYASVIGNNYYSGGIAGRCKYGTVEQCCNGGILQANQSGGVVGGIVGDLVQGEVRDSYNMGNIEKNYFFAYYPGGIVGYNRGKLVNCYNTGIMPDQTLSCMPGGMGSVVVGPTEYCYYNLESLEIPHLYGGRGIDNPLIYSDSSKEIVKSGGCSSAVMKSVETYQTWDFLTIWEFDYNYSSGYPTLRSLKDLLRKNPNQDIKSDKDKKNQFTFTVIDQDGNEVEKATIMFGGECKETGKDGRVKFVYDEKEQGLVISKENYIEYADKKFKMNKTKEYTVCLIEKGVAGQYPLNSVIMDMKGNRYELLTQTKTINRKLNDAKFSINCFPSDRSKTYTKYEIIQGEVVIAESETGEFLLVPEKFQKTKVNNLVRKTKIRLTDTEGKTYQQEINLTIVDEKQIETSVQFGDGIEFTVGENVPIFGKCKIKFDAVNVPVSVYMGDDKWRIGLNIVDWSDTDDVGKIFQSSSDVVEKFEKVKKYIKGKEVSSKPVKVKVELVGYAEGDMPLQSDEIDLKIILKITVSCSQEWQTPSVIVVGLDVEGSISANGEMSINTETLEMDGDAYVEGTVGVAPYLGAGMAKVLSGGIYGDGKMGFKYYFLPIKDAGLDEWYVDGKLKFVVRFLGKNAFEYELLKKKEWLYCRSRDEYYVDKSIDGAYYETAEQWMKGISDLEVQSFTESTAGEWTGSEEILQQSAYSESRPLLMQSDGDTIMIFTSNTLTNREDAEISTLMYSVYDPDHLTWTNPKPIEDDGTADFNPVISGGYVAWNDSKGNLSKCTTLNQMGKRLEIKVASYNAQTKSFQNVRTVTSNQSFENNLSLVKTENGVNINWTVNSEDDVFGIGGTNTLYGCTLTENKLDTNIFTSTDKNILWRENGKINGRLCYLYIVDEDDNIANLEGQIAYAVFLDNKEVVRLSSKSLFAVHCLTKQNKILMIGTDGNIYTMTDLNGEIVQETEDSQVTGAVQQIIEEENGNIAILSTLNGKNNANAYMVLYDSNLAKWSKQMKITDTEHYVEGVSGGYVDGRIIFLYNQRELDLADMNSSGLNSLLWSTVDNNTVQFANAKVDFFERDAVNGAHLPIEVSVTNTGMLACQNVEVIIENDMNEILHETVNTIIMPGETKTLQLAVDVPELKDITEYNVNVIPKENKQGGCITTIKLGAAAYEVERSLYCVNGTYMLTVCVTNNCAEAGDGVIEIFDYNDPDIVYETYPFSELSSDDVLMYDTRLESLNWDKVVFKKIGIRVVRDGQVNGDVRSVVVYKDNCISVDSINLNKSEMDFEKIGDIYRLIARTLPENIPFTQAIWESSNTNVVKVDENGLITAIGEGQADITVTIGDKSAVCKVTVKGKNVILGDVDLNEKVDISDLRLMLRSICGKVQLSAEQIEAGDIAGSANDDLPDGKITIIDLRKLLRFICGKITAL